MTLYVAAPNRNMIERTLLEAINHFQGNRRTLLEFEKTRAIAAAKAISNGNSPLYEVTITVEELPR